jgi:hypothetical protein
MPEQARPVMMFYHGGDINRVAHVMVGVEPVESFPCATVRGAANPSTTLQSFWQKLGGDSLDCYTAVLSTNSTLAGHVVLELGVAADGSVTECKYTGIGEVRACLSAKCATEKLPCSSADGGRGSVRAFVDLVPGK